MFPLGPPGISNSPYQVLSAFAGNPLFINLEKLVQGGLLDRPDLAGFPGHDSAKTDYEAAWRYKKIRFRKAFYRFEFGPKRVRAGFEKFCEAQSFWLDDYALYCALKEKYHGVSWEGWDEEYRRRRPAALRRVAKEFRLKIRYHQFLQFHFFNQWRALKAACRELGVGLIGDVPIFVAHDSADVWAHQELFWLDKKGKPTCVAGCPPDYFSRTGQRWGNPLYRWEASRRTGYDWWLKRIETMFKLFDAARLDHFIGFHNYWRIPADQQTAEKGKWILGPGAPFFETLFRKLGRLDLIAEDLGAITPPVAALRDRFDLPGMRVLQFAFSGKSSNPFLPHNYPVNTVAYTGTHDNDTTVGWFSALNSRDRKRVLNYVGSEGKEINWDLIHLAMGSVAKTAIAPAQDLLGLGTEARMNLPGTPSGNWEWRLKRGSLTPRITRRLAHLTELYGRV